MERKLVKQGRNALTVTIPAAWLKKKGLKAGDTVSVDEKSDKMVVSSLKASGISEVEIDLRGAERSMMFHAVQGKYIEGYDVITILHDKPEVSLEIVSTMLGMIIEEHTEKRTVFKNIVAVPEDNFKKVLKRATFIFRQQARSLVELTKGMVNLNAVKSDERLLDYNLLYCLRYLSKYGRRSSYKYFLLCSTMEAAADQISIIAKHIGKRRKLAEDIAEGIESYTKCLHKNDLSKIYASLRAFRNKFATKTFCDGLAFSLAELLYNYIGFLVESEKSENRNIRI